MKLTESCSTGIGLLKKHMGTGLAYRVDNVEFHHTNWTNIYVNMNGEVKNEWRFWLSELGKGHLVINFSLSSKYIQCKGMRNFSLISLCHAFNLQVNVFQWNNNAGIHSKRSPKVSC